MKSRLFSGAPSRLAALFVVAGDYPAPPHALPVEKIHRFHLSRYG
jgi:hypothetical protein